MNENLSHYTYEDASADVFCFDNDTEVKEYHAMIHVVEKGMPLLIITSELESLRIKAGRFYSFFTEHSTDELWYSINIC